MQAREDRVMIPSVVDVLPGQGSVAGTARPSKGENGKRGGGDVAED
jgi:hypothetical protein